MGGGGGSSSEKTEVRYAPYLENNHGDFIDTMRLYREAIIDESPFSGYVDIEIDDAFFGAGYVISSFPSLYDMYGKFMAGLDIDALYNQLFEDTVNSTEVSNLVAAEAAFLEDDIDANTLPRFQTGMRDINSVIASSFVIGKTLIEETRLKAVAKFSAELKYKLIPVVSDRWKTHLEWNRGMISTYAEMMKLYYAAKIDVDDANYSFAAKNRLWPFTVMEYERAAIGALNGAAAASSGGVAGASQSSKAIGGALAGAAAGAMMTPTNPLMGGLIGGALGLGASFL